jgi:hypothetical protein
LQSGIATGAGIFDAVSMLAAKPAAAGSVATDRLIRMAIMIRAIRIVILCFIASLSQEATKLNLNVAPIER